MQTGKFSNMFSSVYSANERYRCHILTVWFEFLSFYCRNPKFDHFSPVLTLQSNNDAQTTTFGRFEFIWSSSSDVLPFHHVHLPTINKICVFNVIASPEIAKSNHARVTTGLRFSKWSEHAETRQQWYWKRVGTCGIRFSIFLRPYGWSLRDIGSNSDDYNAVSL